MSGKDWVPTTLDGWIDLVQHYCEQLPKDGSREAARLAAETTGWMEESGGLCHPCGSDAALSSSEWASVDEMGEDTPYTPWDASTDE